MTASASSPAAAGAPTMLSERASEAIASAIIKGDLAPGSRLGVRELSTRFGIGPTPLREALNGLAGRGLVVAVGQRGFRVAPVSEADLVDLMAARTAVEIGALRLAIAAGDADWEAGIVAALHKLKRFSAAPPKTVEERVSSFEQLNRDFHMALIAACGSDRLIAVAGEFYDQAERYRNLMLRVRDVSRGMYQEHLDIAEPVLARQADEACARLAAHNQKIRGLVYGSADAPEAPRLSRRKSA